MKFTVDGVTYELHSIIGVKQGDILGPILFLFFIAAVMITWKKTYTGSFCIFRSKQDYTMTGRSYKSRGDEFELADSEYADDTAVLFEDRTEAEVGVPHIINHFARFGMEVHQGDRHPKKGSKSEALFCSKPLHLYEDRIKFFPFLKPHVCLKPFITLVKNVMNGVYLVKIGHPHLDIPP